MCGPKFLIRPRGNQFRIAGFVLPAIGTTTGITIPSREVGKYGGARRSAFPRCRRWCFPFWRTRGTSGCAENSLTTEVGRGEKGCLAESEAGRGRRPISFPGWRSRRLERCTESQHHSGIEDTAQLAVLLFLFHSSWTRYVIPCKALLSRDGNLILGNELSAARPRTTREPPSAVRSHSFSLAAPLAFPRGTLITQRRATFRGDPPFPHTLTILLSEQFHLHASRHPVVLAPLVHPAFASPDAIQCVTRSPNTFPPRNLSAASTLWLALLVSRDIRKVVLEVLTPIVVK